MPEFPRVLCGLCGLRAQAIMCWGNTPGGWRCEGCDAEASFDYNTGLAGEIWARGDLRRLQDDVAAEFGRMMDLKRAKTKCSVMAARLAVSDWLRKEIGLPESFHPSERSHYDEATATKAIATMRAVG